jgi:hypothetical protein
MVTLQSIRHSLLSTVGQARPSPDAGALRELCATLLVDVPASDRKSMLQRLERMRRADDKWHLRAALFDTISRVHGETVARQRLVTLDRQLG